MFEYSCEGLDILIRHSTTAVQVQDCHVLEPQITNRLQLGGSSLPVFSFLHLQGFKQMIFTLKLLEVGGTVKGM